MPIAAPSRPRSRRSTTTRTTSRGSSGSTTADGAVAHTACLGFGLERIVLALMQTHGLDPAAWPDEVRGALVSRPPAASRSSAPTRRATRRMRCTPRGPHLPRDQLLRRRPDRAAARARRRAAGGARLDGRARLRGRPVQFFKPDPGELERLYGIDIHEMQPYRRLPDQIAEQLGAGRDDDRRARRVVPARHGGDRATAASTSRRRSARGDRPRRARAAVLPQRRALRAGGEDYRGVFRLDGRSTALLPPYAELVRFDAGARLTGDALRDAARSLLRRHLRAPAGGEPVRALRRGAAARPAGAAARATRRTTTPTRSRPCGWSARASSSARRRPVAVRRATASRAEVRAGEIVDGSSCCP